MNTFSSWCCSKPSPGSYDSNDDPLSMWNIGGSLRRGDVLRHSSASCSVVAGGPVAVAAAVTTAVTGGPADGASGGCGGGGPTTSAFGRSIGDHKPDCQQKSNDLLFCLRSIQSYRRRSARLLLVPEAAAATWWLRYQVRVRGSRCVVALATSTTAAKSQTDAQHTTKRPYIRHANS